MLLKERFVKRAATKKRLGAKGEPKGSVQFLGATKEKKEAPIGASFVTQFLYSAAEARAQRRTLQRTLY